MEAVWNSISAFCGIVRKKAPLEYTEDTMGDKKIETPSIEMLFAKFCLKNREMDMGSFYFLMGVLIATEVHTNTGNSSQLYSQVPMPWS